MLRRVLMTADAVGGVWRYATDLSAGLEAHGVRVLIAGFGPAPADAQTASAVEWIGEPLDWLTEDEAALDSAPGMLARMARDWGADLIHVNAPTQAAGLPPGLPVVAASHSCVPTWWNAVRGGLLPASWRWQASRNEAGLARAGAVLAPSRSHAAALRATYGEIDGLRVVPNATAPAEAGAGREPFILAAGRWWDEGKGGDVLDAAAAAASWPVLAAGAMRGPAGQTAAFAHAEALGELPGGHVRRLMARAAIFAAPSRYEPFGLAVLEAAVRGCALVLSDIPTFRELWDGAAVFADPDGFADALNALAVDPARAARLADAARSRAAGLTPARQLAGVLGAYKAAMRHALETA